MASGAAAAPASAEAKPALQAGRLGNDSPGSPARGLARRTKMRFDNPYTVPDSQTIFAMRDEDTRKKAEERERMRTMSIAEKSTLASQRARLLTARRASEVLSDEEAPTDDDVRQAARMQMRQEWIDKAASALRKHEAGERQNLQRFTELKRAMFLRRFKIAVKHKEMERLVEEEHERMQQVANQRDLIGSERDKFDEFAKESAVAAEAAKKRLADELAMQARRAHVRQDLAREIEHVNRIIGTLTAKAELYRSFEEFFALLAPQLAPTPLPPGVLPQVAAADALQADPHKLLAIFQDLESANLTLAQQYQALEEERVSLDARWAQLDSTSAAEIARLEARHEALQQTLRLEEQRLAETRSRQSYFTREAAHESSQARDARRRLGATGTSRSRSAAAAAAAALAASRDLGGMSPSAQLLRLRAEVVKLLALMARAERGAAARRATRDAGSGAGSGAAGSSAPGEPGAAAADAGVASVGTEGLDSGLDVVSMLTAVEKYLRDLFDKLAALCQDPSMAEELVRWEKRQKKEEDDSKREGLRSQFTQSLESRRTDAERRSMPSARQSLGKPLMRRSDPYTKLSRDEQDDASKREEALLLRYFFE